MGGPSYYTTPEGEEVKLTSSQLEFLKDAEGWLRGALGTGKTWGKVPLDSEVYLRLDPDLTYPGGVGRRSQGKHSVYVVTIPPESIGDWDTIRHEGGHVLLGHPEKGPSSGRLEEWGDFEGYARRELQTDFSSRKALGLLSELYQDISNLVWTGVDSFSLDPKDSFGTVKKVARDIGVSFQHIKRAREHLEEADFFW